MNFESNPIEWLDQRDECIIEQKELGKATRLLLSSLQEKSSTATKTMRIQNLKSNYILSREAVT